MQFQLRHIVITGSLWLPSPKTHRICTNPIDVIGQGQGLGPDSYHSITKTLCYTVLLYPAPPLENIGIAYIPGSRLLFITVIGPV